MTRDEAIFILKKFMDKIEKFYKEDSITNIFLFGSIAKGSSMPEDLDIFMVVDSTEWLRYAKAGRLLWNKFRGRNQNIDLYINSTKEFDFFCGYIFGKVDLVEIWNRENKNWEERFSALCPVDENYKSAKAFQYSEFSGGILLKRKVQYAVEEEIIKVKRFPAEPYFTDEGPWEVEEITFYKNGESRTEIVNKYEDCYAYLEKLRSQKINSQYINTLKVLYSFIFKESICLEDYYNVHINPRCPYPTYERSDEGDTVIRFYLVEIDSIFFHLMGYKEITTLILIPKYKATAKTNYLYVVKRGKNWNKKSLKVMEEKNFGLSLLTPRL